MSHPQSVQKSYEWKVARRKAFEYYGDICYLCGRPGANSIDHIVPVVAGGTNDLTNLRPAHMSCNNRKHTRAGIVNPERYGVQVEPYSHHSTEDIAGQNRQNSRANLVQNRRITA